MISPDAGDMGVKAVYVWAGMLVPTVVILYFYYPEVRELVFFRHRSQLTYCAL